MFNVNELIRPGACIIKHFMAVINSIMYKASVFVIVNNFKFALTNTLAFNIIELITAVKGFMIQAPRELSAKNEQK
jgi:hypothetical protein